MYKHLINIRNEIYASKINFQIRYPKTQNQYKINEHINAHQKKKHLH